MPLDALPADQTRFLEAAQLWVQGQLPEGNQVTAECTCECVTRARIMNTPGTKYDQIAVEGNDPWLECIWRINSNNIRTPDPQWCAFAPDYRLPVTGVKIRVDITLQNRHEFSTHLFIPIRNTDLPVLRLAAKL